MHDFAGDNDGIYPGTLNFANLAGKTLLDYLPSGQMLRNAFSGLRTEPNGSYPVYPGNIGFTSLCEATINVGFVIVARGADSTEELYLSFPPDW